jgi:SAM-dependent methyltransferase
MTALIPPIPSDVGDDGVMAPLLVPGAGDRWDLRDHAESRGGVWLARSADAVVSYPDEVHATLAGLEERSLWFRSRNRLIAAVLAAHTDATALLEVGAGNGHVAAFLTRQGIPTVTVEPSYQAANTAATRGVHASVCGLLEDLRLPDRALRVAGAFDVIEHLPDERPLLAELYRILAPGGFCVVTVPAFALLWSQADEAAGHHRRYVRPQLDERFADAGFEHVFSSYCFSGAVVPLYLARARPYRRGRRLSAEELQESLERELAGQGRLTTAIGEVAARAEAWRLRRGRIPVGTSVIGVYRRPAER